MSNLIGTRFGKLVVHSEQDDKHFVLCQCDCGETKVVLYYNLLNGMARSCGKKGCRGYTKGGSYKKKNDKVYGTPISKISSTIIPKNNKTGVKGVWYNEKRGKYEAYIYLRGNKIHLGHYNTLSEASAEREKAEDKYFAPMLLEASRASA